MSSSVERFDERARLEAERLGTTRVHRHELLRHPVYTRVLHWLVAITFVLSLLSGFALYSPWLFRFLTPIFGGGAVARLLHPWFGLFFVIFFFFQFLNWLGPMMWNESDSRWIKRLRGYVSNKEKLESEDVGFFNAGQKIYFWIIALSGVLFLLTGLLMWFDNLVPRWITVVSYVIHDLAALVMLAGFIIHIYEGTAAQPGTFRAMIDGTVTEKWAWTHHPGWFRRVTGRDPREAFGRAQRRQRERQRLISEYERKRNEDDVSPARRE